MRNLYRPWLVAMLLPLGGVAALGQEKPPTPGAAPIPTGPAATVNGQAISEVAVQRGLKRVPPARQTEARPEIVNYLIDNLLIEQHLQRLRVDVDIKEVNNRVEQVRAEIKKGGQDFQKVMQDLMLSEDELRSQIAADMRWDKYAGGQATDKVLHELFDKSPEMFDGSMVRARHILLTPATTTPAGLEEARQKLAFLRRQIEDEVAKSLAAEKLPPDADALAREKVRARVTDEKFAEFAAKNSACPSKTQGGDVGWFPRTGSMVEPFARAAFALKPYQISDVVTTQFGAHVILTTDRKPGKETKFDEVKEEVREVYCERLRESLCAELRQKGQIVVNPPPTQ
jgi:peptidyl-prolyl cis-trans isomerase C